MELEFPDGEAVKKRYETTWREELLLWRLSFSSSLQALDLLNEGILNTQARVATI